MKHRAAIALMLLATPALGQAKEEGRGAQASEAQVQELTAQYTALVRTDQIDKAIKTAEKEADAVKARITALR